MKKYADRREQWNRSDRGFSLVEAIIAIAVLSIGVLSLARLIPFATRTDSTATFIAMRQMEQILAQPWSVTSFEDAPDDAGTTATVDLSCTCAAVPCGASTGVPAGTAGGPLTAAGIINFSAMPFPGYQRFYAIDPTPVAGAVKVNQGQYEVRWHITCNLYGSPGGVANGTGLYNIVVAARPVGNLPGMIAIPAHVRAVKMK